jgi:hypothetical protein
MPGRLTVDEHLAAPALERVRLRFDGTYYFVHTLDSFISRHSILSVAFSDHFHEGLEHYVAPFRRWTALHAFIEFFIDQVIFEDLNRASDTKYIPKGSCTRGYPYCPASPSWLLAVDLMQSHGYDVAEIATELSQWVEAGSACCPEPIEGEGPDFDLWSGAEPNEYHYLLQDLTEEVFFVLFANRTFLCKFHTHLASYVSDAGSADWIDGQDIFRKDRSDRSVLKRATIPAWARRAVFFRDRGRCCRCERDLGGSYSPINRAEYDHIVPLDLGGLNDVSNLQLLCKECNNRKRAVLEQPGQTYERWFPTERIYMPRRIPSPESGVREVTDRPPSGAGTSCSAPASSRMRSTPAEFEISC